ncbi:efflux RND transporter periplasmic adaptor subunit [Desulfotomaculum sp. 1211_IL3151]|uniref:efflux RND transporter periplasmic adaptor subunit n=1 Tax=Desulfotomaculum sp. 1211_IL3151 TaxID=3084055 RepID=UPI002FDA3531
MTRKAVLIGTLALLCIFQIGCSQNNIMSQTPQIKKQASTSTTSTGRAAEAKDNKITMSGKIEAVEIANIVSKVAGKVAQVNVDIGTEVKAGQLLISLEAADKAAEIEEAAALVNSAQVQFDLDQKNYQRGKELLISQAISQADYEKTYEGPVQRSEASLKTAKATLKKRQVTYDDMFIKAPFAGVITAKNINPGEMAGTQNVLLTLVNLNRVVVKGFVNENQINKLKQGQEVQVKVGAVSDQTFIGKISNLAFAADPQTKGYLINVRIDNPEYLLKPGMFAEVLISGN